MEVHSSKENKCLKKWKRKDDEDRILRRECISLGVMIGYSDALNWTMH